MAFAGAWRKQTVRQPDVPLVQPTDPRHLVPENEQDANYVDTTGAPYLPSEIEDGQYVQGNVPALFLDRTPLDPNFGVGDLPGVSHAEAREIAGDVHQLDFGAVAQREWESPGRREGTYEVTRVQNVPMDGASPITVDIRSNIGAGSPYDPDARRNVRIQRWRDRTIDMHWWSEQMRPLPVANAKTAPELPALSGGPTVSPYAGNLITDPRNWQTPQERRTPREWDEGMTTDGTEPNPLAQQAFGLTMWGL